MRPLGDGKAEIAPDLHHFLPHLAHRVNGARSAGPRRKRHVDLLGGQAGLDGGVLEHQTALGDGLRDLFLQRVEGGTGRFALLRRQGAKRLHALRDRALLAQRRNPDGFQARLVAGLRDGAEKIALQGLKIGLFAHSWLPSPLPRSRPRVRPLAGPRTGSGGNPAGPRQPRLDPRFRGVSGSIDTGVAWPQVLARHQRP
jgi:hypothetical protein